MILVGLTGGIGSGKSTVASMLAALGAVIVDADQVVRDVQRPGSPVLTKLAERFGPEVIGSDGELDRAAVAAKAFADPDALADLNKIVHPAVGDEMNRRVEELSTTEQVVVLDIPLLAERPREGLQATIVVDVPAELQLERLQGRGMDPADAEARMGRQASREDRLAIATDVLDNSGTFDDLQRQVEAVWVRVQQLPQLPPGQGLPQPKAAEPTAD
jgi:dephospho-CoA kinase